MDVDKSLSRAGASISGRRLNPDTFLFSYLFLKCLTSSTYIAHERNTRFSFSVFVKFKKRHFFKILLSVCVLDDLVIDFMSNNVVSERPADIFSLRVFRIPFFP